MLAASGCADPTFAIDLDVPPACNTPRGFYLEFFRPGSGERECAVDLCPAGDTLKECLAGVETPPVAPGEPFQLHLGLYNGERNLIGCGGVAVPEGVNDQDRIELRVTCETTGSPCPTTITPQQLQTQECAR